MIDIIPYEGDHPYIFVSYGHDDASIVESYIKILQDKLCYIWYDAGVGSGSDWNKTISAHLKNCGAVLLFLSKNSMASNNVKNEIIAAKNVDKRIIILSLDGEPYDFEWQCLLGSYNFKIFKNVDDAKNKDERKELSEYNEKVLIDSIPKEFFKNVSMPFFQIDKNKFYIIESEDKGTFDTQHISFLLDNGSERKTLLKLAQGGPFDVSLIKQKIETGEMVPTVEKFNVMSDFKKPNSFIPVIFSVIASDYYGYPTYGPNDLRYALNFAIINPESEDPTVKLLVGKDKFGFYTKATCMDGVSSYCAYCGARGICKNGLIEKYTLHLRVVE